MDRSLDEIIKEQKPAGTNPFAASAGKAPGGKKGKGGKGKGGGGGDGKAALVKAVNQNNKAKRAQKMAAARGMDVDMSAPTSNALAKARRGKAPGGKKGGLKLAVGKAAGAVGKAMNTLKAKMAAASQTVFGGGKGGGKPMSAGTKASDIKITIPGASVGRSPQQGSKKSPGRSPNGRAPGGGKGKGKGGIMKPGAQVGKSGGAIRKQGGQKMRTVVVGSGGKSPKAGGGKGTSRGRGGGGGGGRGLMARAGR